jgi:hypothetical protein
MKSTIRPACAILILQAMLCPGVSQAAAPQGEERELRSGAAEGLSTGDELLKGAAPGLDGISVRELGGGEEADLSALQGVQSREEDSVAAGRESAILNEAALYQRKDSSMEALVPDSVSRRSAPECALGGERSVAVRTEHVSHEERICTEYWEHPACTVTRIMSMETETIMKEGRNGPPGTVIEYAPFPELRGTDPADVTFTADSNTYIVSLPSPGNGWTAVLACPGSSCSITASVRRMAWHPEYSPSERLCSPLEGETASYTCTREIHEGDPALQGAAPPEGSLYEGGDGLGSVCLEAVIAFSGRKIPDRSDECGSDVKGCALRRSECVEGTELSNGECGELEKVYSCETRTYTEETRTVSDGGGCSVPCYGTECARETVRETGSDLAKASAISEAAMGADTDMSCDGGACMVFSGSGRGCSRKAGGLVNCCKKGGSSRLTDYMDMYSGVRDILRRGKSREGGKDALWSGDTESEKDVTEKPVSSGKDSADAGTPEKKGDEDTTRETSEEFRQKYGDSSASKLFSSDGSSFRKGRSQTMPSLMDAFEEFGVRNIFGDLLSCPEDDLRATTRAVSRSCHYLGSYCSRKVLGVCLTRRSSWCCFSSPLARIVQEQGRAQLARSFGSARHPECRGFTMEELGALDWDMMDLSEWVEIEKETGHFPDEEKAAKAGENLGTDLYGRSYQRAEASAEKLDAAAESGGSMEDLSR